MNNKLWLVTIFLLLIGIVSATPTLIDSRTNGAYADVLNWNEPSAITNGLGLVYTPSQSFDISRFAVRIYNYASPCSATRDIIITPQIYTESGNNVGTLLYTGTPIHASALSSTESWINFNFPGTNPLVSGTNYILTFHTDQYCDLNNYISISGSQPFTPGSVKSTDFGSTWQIEGVDEFDYQTYSGTEYIPGVSDGILPYQYSTFSNNDSTQFFSDYGPSMTIQDAVLVGDMFGAAYYANGGIHHATNLNTNTNLGSIYPGNFTFMIWINTTTGGTQKIYGQYSGGYIVPVLQITDSTIYWQFDYDEPTNYTELTVSSTTKSLADGNAHYIVVTKNGGACGDYQIYVDGDLQTISTCTGGVAHDDSGQGYTAASAYNVRLGAQGNNAAVLDSYYYFGTLDNFGLYDAYFTQAKIKQYYDAYLNLNPTVYINNGDPSTYNASNTHYIINSSVTHSLYFNYMENSTLTCTDMNPSSADIRLYYGAKNIIIHDCNITTYPYFGAVTPTANYDNFTIYNMNIQNNIGLYLENPGYTLTYSNFDIYNSTFSGDAITLFTISTTTYIPNIKLHDNTIYATNTLYGVNYGGAKDNYIGMVDTYNNTYPAFTATPINVMQSNIENNIQQTITWQFPPAFTQTPYYCSGNGCAGILVQNNTKYILDFATQPFDMAYSTFILENVHDVIIDCQGNSIISSQPYTSFVVISKDVNNLIIENCNLYNLAPLLTAQSDWFTYTNNWPAVQNLHNVILENNNVYRPLNNGGSGVIGLYATYDYPGFTNGSIDNMWMENNSYCTDVNGVPGSTNDPALYYGTSQTGNNIYFDNFTIGQYDHILLPQKSCTYNMNKPYYGGNYTLNTCGSYLAYNSKFLINTSININSNNCLNLIPYQNKVINLDITCTDMTPINNGQNTVIAVSGWTYGAINEIGNITIHDCNFTKNTMDLTQRWTPVFMGGGAEYNGAVAINFHDITYKNIDLNNEGLVIYNGHFFFNGPNMQGPDTLNNIILDNIKGNVTDVTEFDIPEGNLINSYILNSNYTFNRPISNTPRPPEFVVSSDGVNYLGDNNPNGYNLIGTFTSINTTATGPAVPPPPYVPPSYENQTFAGQKTTDLNNVTNIAAVDNFTVATTGSAVVWSNPVDLSNVTNVGAVIVASPTIMSINVQAVPSLNTPAAVGLTIPPTNNNACQNFQLYYARGFYLTTADVVAHGEVIATGANVGGDCTDPTICTNVRCSNGVLVFDAQHFDGFAVTSLQVDTPTSSGLLQTRNLVYAGLALLAVLILVIVAWGLIQAVQGGNVDFMTLTIVVIGGGIVLMIAYIVIYFVFKALGG